METNKKEDRFQIMKTLQEQKETEEKTKVEEYRNEEICDISTETANSEWMTPFARFAKEDCPGVSK